MDRAIVGHVEWNVHATGTWKPPPGLEDDNSMEDYTEDEEEDRVSDWHFGLRLYTLLFGFTPTKACGTCAHENLCRDASCCGASFQNRILILSTTPV